MKILELPGLCLLPAPLLYWRALLPMLYQTGGSILGIQMALYYGWCINLGGGFHHASSNSGGGFCVYADITLAIKSLRMIENGRYSNYKVLIVDLDAHQGNGHERDKRSYFNNNTSNLRILDAYNVHIYPGDDYAARGIDYPIYCTVGQKDNSYLSQLNDNLDKVFNEYNVQFVVYNAGTDCLKGDRLGCMAITPQGIIDRDEIVFKKCKTKNVPILMVLSGGYQMNNANIIANSINNLKSEGLLNIRLQNV